MPQELDSPRGVVRSAGEPTAFRLAARVLDITPLPVAYVSAGLVFLQCNEAAAKWLGRPAEEILGKPAEAIVGRGSPLVKAASEAARSRRRVTQALYGDSGKAANVVTCTPDIDVKDRLLGLVLVIAEAAEPGGEAVGIPRPEESAETTEAERDLLRNLEMLRAVVEHSVDGISIGTTDGHVVLYSPAMERISGYTMAEVNEHGWFDLVYPDPEQRARARAAVALGAREGALEAEASLTRKDGEVRWVRYRMTPVRVDSRELSMAIVTDLTKRHTAELALEESEALFRTLFDLSPAGAAQVTADGGIVRVNRRFAEMLGYPAEQLETMTFQQITHPADVGADLAGVRRLQSGETDSFTIEKRYVRADGTSLWALLSTSAIRNPDGSLRYMVGVVQDISQRKRAEQLSAASNDIDVAIHSSLEFEDIMQRVVTEAVQALRSDCGRVVLREGGRWVTRFGYKLPPGTEHDSYTDEQTPCFGLAARTRSVVAIDDVQKDAAVETASMRTVGVLSALVVPLVSHDKVIGMLRFEYTSQRMHFTVAEIGFAEHVASSVAQAVENARLYHDEQHVADTLQEAMIRMPEHLAGIDFCWLYGSATKTTRIGGDFLDLFELADGRIGILVGDVSGKGLRAAALTGLIKNIVRAYAYEDASPSQVLQRVNCTVVRETDDETFATVFFGALDPLTGWVTYCSGGHPPALVRRGDGAVRILASESPLVGAFTGVTYDEAYERIGTGDTLLLYTDGAIEARSPSGELFGDERLARTLAAVPDDVGVKATCSEVFEAVSSFSQGSLADDIALLAITLDPSTLER